MHRILISGASGFIGSNLSSYLKNKEHFVSSVSLRGNWKADPNHQVYIHLAGIEKDTNKVSDNHEYLKINSHLTLEFFQAFLNSDAKKFIFFSSCKSVLDSSINPILGTTKTEPLTEYGKSKLLAENLIQAIELPFDKELFNKALSDGKVVVVSSWIKYCSSCASQMKVLDKAKNQFDNIEYFTFNVTNKEIAKLFNVQYQTTLLIFKDDKEIYRSIGETTKDLIYKAIQSSI